MDIELLKTFLEVNRTRHFGKAAEHLFLTQSAVSVRIRQLEQTLGFESPRMAELGVVELVGIRLVMVTTHAGIQPNAALARDDYVLVDWGTGFANAHAQAFGGAPPPRLRIGLGRLAHDFLRDHGGSAYLPEAMVADDLGAGRLLQVAGAPLMERATYAFHHRDANRNGRFDALLATLRRT